MNQNRFISFFVLFFLLGFFSSCTTPRWRLKDSSSQLSSKNSTTAFEEELKLASTAEARLLSNLYQKLLLEPLEERDSEELKRIIAKSERSSLEEAILALSVMQIFIKQHESYQQVPSDQKEKFSFNSDALLAQLCASANIDLISLVQNNVFLKTFDSYKLFAKIKKYNKNPGERTGLSQSIHKNFLELHDFALLNNPINSDNLAEEDELLDIALNDLGEKKEKKNASAAILERVDTLLASNQFFEAISLLKEIDESEELYDRAQEKVSLISSKAVNSLRKKAAVSYQNANQLKTDVKAREVYLVEAKTILQAAIDLYPKANQIDRVKSNLKIIDDNLKFLKKGRLEKR